MNRHALIKVALNALSLARAPLWLPRVADAAGFVVTLHHVRPARSEAFDPNALLSVTPEFLDRFITRFTGLGWRFVSVDDIVARGMPPQAKSVAITLDDGYRNNFEQALPVFQRHAVPFTIYVCPGFAERTSELWWEALERIIRAADAVRAPGADSASPLSARTPAEKLSAFHAWRAWLTTVADETEQRVAIRALATEHGLDVASLARELVMDWEETRTIAANPLCTIGAHTMTHAALARLSPKAAFQEIAGSIERIAAEIGKRPTTMAFPYGYPAAAGSREAELAKQAGLVASFMTQPGYVPGAASRHGLPRVSINGLFQDVRFLEMLLTPGLWKLRDRIRKRR